MQNKEGKSFWWQKIFFLLSFLSRHRHKHVRHCSRRMVNHDLTCWLPSHKCSTDYIRLTLSAVHFHRLQFHETNTNCAMTVFSRNDFPDRAVLSAHFIRLTVWTIHLLQMQAEQSRDETTTRSLDAGKLWILWPRIWMSPLYFYDIKLAATAHGTLGGSKNPIMLVNMRSGRANVINTYGLDNTTSFSLFEGQVSWELFRLQTFYRRFIRFNQDNTVQETISQKRTFWKKDWNHIYKTDKRHRRSRRKITHTFYWHFGTLVFLPKDYYLTSFIL